MSSRFAVILGSALLATGRGDNEGLKKAERKPKESLSFPSLWLSRVPRGGRFDFYRDQFCLAPTSWTASSDSRSISLPHHRASHDSSHGPAAEIAAMEP